MPTLLAAFPAMSPFQRRTRTVIFRLTDNEYEQLKSACEKRGARTVSDYARTELLRSIARDRHEVTDTLAEIQSGVHRLEKLITGIAKGEREH